HSFFIPAFRAKQDVVPGRYTTIWLTAKTPEGNEPAEYHMTCTEDCGAGHSAVFAKVVVHPTRASFEAWLAEQGNVPDTAESGERIYKQLCASCHNIEGAVGQGPNWKDLAQLMKSGEARNLADGNS